MKTPEGKTISFTFHSQPLKDLKCRWKATVTFPAGADDETFASVTLADGEGVEIESGEFEFAGMRIAVKDGRGSCRETCAGRVGLPSGGVAGTGDAHFRISGGYCNG